MIIASWNIEKCGISSSENKRAALDCFIYDNTVDGYADLVFLCEVHNARVDDFIEYLTAVVGETYRIDWVSGNYSNNYVYLIKKERFKQEDVVRVSTWRNERPMLALQCSIGSGTVYVGLIHAKSGRTGLTKTQLNNAMEWLQARSHDKWLLTGDLNWSFDDYDQLSPPDGSKYVSCWPDMTQRRGGILDWAIYGKYTTVTANALSQLRTLDQEVLDCSEMDHRPVIFSVR